MSDNEMDDDDKMGLTGCGKFLKYTMFIFNSIILVAGCALLGFGVYSRTSENRLTQLSSILGSFYYSTLSLALIITGGVVIILAFLGCCGALKEVKCMLGTFFVLLLVMLLGMVVGGIVGYFYRDTIGDVILEEMYSSLNTTYGAESDVTGAWDSMQSIFSCCGVDGGLNSSTSWAYYKKHSAWFANQTGHYIKEYVPESCCRNTMGENKTKCVGGVGFEHFVPAVGPPVSHYQENDILFTDGCYTAVLGFLNDNVRIFGGIAAGVAVLMIMGMTFAICLLRRIKDEFMFD